MTKPNRFRKTHAVSSWVNLILSVVLVGCVFASIVINLPASPNGIVQEVGIKTFRMHRHLSKTGGLPVQAGLNCFSEVRCKLLAYMVQ